MTAEGIVGIRPRAVAGSLAGTLTLGAVSGVAGFCTGPVLGAILTLALTSASPIRGGTILAVYGIGMVLPIMFIASLIRRFGHRPIGWMRGRQFHVGRLRFHSTSLLMGAITVLVGWLMIFTNGMASVPELLPAGFVVAMENLGRQIDAFVPSWIWTALVGALLLGWWLRAAVRRTNGNAHEAIEPAEPDPIGRDPRTSKSR